MEIRNLILADVRRVLHKKSFWIVLAFLLLYSIAMALAAKYQKWNGFAFVSKEEAAIKELSYLILSISIFNSVYADGFKARSIASVIGRGISRTGIVIAKIIDCLILAAISYALIGISVFIIAFSLKADLNLEESKYLLALTCLGVYKVVLMTSVSSVVIYATENIPFSLFSAIFISETVPMILEGLEKINFFRSLHISRYHFKELTGQVFSGIMLGSGWLIPFCTGIIYLGLAFLLSMFFFGRKELDF